MDYCLILILLCCCNRGQSYSGPCCETRDCRPEIPCRNERLICSEEDDVVYDVEPASIKISDKPEIINER